jgi:hypothetical protein
VGARLLKFTVSQRHTNLALLQTYGPNVWRTHNYLLEETAKQAEKALEELKQRTTDINRERKNSQVGLVFIDSTLIFTFVATQDTDWEPVDIVREKMDRVDFKHPPD